MAIAVFRIIFNFNIRILGFPIPEDPHVQRYLTDLATHTATDITSETSGFLDDFDPATAESDAQTKSVYDLSRFPRRGVLVIIQSKSPTADVDVPVLRRVFEKLGFKVKVHNNLTARQMEETTLLGNQFSLHVPQH